MTVNETWVYYYEPENKAQSRQWVGSGSPRLKTQKALLCWEKYNNWSVLCKLARPAVKNAEPQDNARVHICKVAMDAVERNGYELIPHPAYSLPSDFFLFQNLKK